MSSANPYSAPESAPSEGGSSGDGDLVSPLIQVSGWMLLLGW
ncbi:MAG: hypothetical protein R3236_10865 [Phycisphaeraceae bacterium]|nr:hypothetical protein [Phycisphaeraceae bacterium]